MKEKLFLFFSAVVTSGAALLSYPIVTRFSNSDELAKASAIFLVNGLLGAFDWSRPVITRKIAYQKQAPSPTSLLRFSRRAIIIGTTISTIAAALFFDDRLFSTIDLLAIFVSSVAIGTTYAFWAVLDAHGRVGTAQMLRAVSSSGLYLVIATLLYIDSQIDLALVLAATSITCLLAMAYFAWPLLGASDEFFYEPDHREVYLIGLQSAAKVANDFGDRILATRFLPIQVIGIYNSLSEIAAKTNLPAQLSAQYYFPILCRKGQRDLIRFVYLSAAFSVLICALSWITHIFGEKVLLLYLGQGFSDEHKTLSALISISNVYSLAFSTQAILRSRGLQKELTRAFWTCSALGALVLISSLVIGGEIRFPHVLLIALALKSVSALSVKHLFDTLDRRSFFLLAFSLLIAYATAINMILVHFQ